MGATLRRLIEPEHQSVQTRRRAPQHNSETFPDLAQLPPELSLAVLSHLNATDLCLAACVWEGLAQDEVLWHTLCKDQWGYVTAYEGMQCDSFRRLYMRLDEGSLTFNANCFAGMEYFHHHNLVAPDAKEVALFLHRTCALNRRQVRTFLESRRDVLDELVRLHNYENQFLPNALRRFFMQLQAPNDRSSYLSLMLDRFSHRFAECNPQLGLTADEVYIVCFSLILLSVDLASPHVKNKMSKREFIRNLRYALHHPDDDLYGHLYDNIYVGGHIAPNSLD